MASRSTLCVQCGFKIQPGEGMRINFEQMRCPKCGADFILEKERAK